MFTGKTVGATLSYLRSKHCLYRLGRYRKPRETQGVFRICVSFWIKPASEEHVEGQGTCACVNGRG